MSSPRTTRRGFTLVELLIVIGVGSIVLGALGALYTYAMAQTGDGLAELLATDQATTAARDMEWNVRNAVLCEVVTKNGIKALRCKMPSLGVDLNGDGQPDSYRPATLNKQGLERFALGTRVWYYLSNATGTFGTTGTILWRAQTAGDAAPTTAELDKAWTYLYANAASPRFPLVAALDFSVDATNRLATLDLTATCADYAERRPTASDSTARQRGIRLVRRIFWENWRT